MSTSPMAGLWRRFPGAGYLRAAWIPAVDLTPDRITAGYLLLGFAALYVSDVLFVQQLSEPVLSQVQALKGGVEVVLTGGFIYALTARRERQLGDRRRAIERQRQELKVLHRVFRHNLRNDLNIIKGYVELLCADDTEHAEATSCEKIDQTLERVERYTENAGRINRITARNGEVARFDLSERIPKLRAEFESRDDDVEIQTGVPSEGPVVEANVGFLDCLEELVGNAVRHSETDPVRVRVEVDADPGAPDMVAVRIVDNGPGLPEVERRALEAGEEGDILHLSGMGLWYVAWTMQQSEGELEFEENAAGGTTAILRVPNARDPFVNG